jgi:MAE_28990/MAE_18760-like HEPN
MDNLSIAFEERLQEVETYLDLLEALEKQVQDGTPQFGESGTRITAQQQRILYSSVYLQLYNLVESTITSCLETVSRNIVDGGIHPAHLSEPIRRQWVRSTARTHVDLNYENRLDSALSLCNHLVQAVPISTFKIEKGAGGNWDDESISEIMGDRLGFSFRITPDVYRGVKRPFRDDKGPLKFIRHLRNELAHGSLSFAECSEGMTVSDLRELTGRTSSYLREVISCLNSSIEMYEFLTPEQRI